MDTNYSPEKEKELTKLIAQKYKEIANLDKKLKTLRGKILLTCETNFTFKGKGCGARIPINEITYIQTMSYDSSTGNWDECEGQFDCPKCGYRNRLLNNPRFEKRKIHKGNLSEDREALQEFRGLFKNVVTEED